MGVQVYKKFLNNIYKNIGKPTHSSTGEAQSSQWLYVCVRANDALFLLLE